MSSPTKLRQMAKELGWPPELEKAADQLQKLKRENAELREQLDAARKHSDLVVTFLARAQVELVETRHYLNKSKEAQP